MSIIVDSNGNVTEIDEVPEQEEKTNPLYYPQKSQDMSDHMSEVVNLILDTYSEQLYELLKLECSKPIYCPKLMLDFDLKEVEPIKVSLDFSAAELSLEFEFVAHAFVGNPGEFQTERDFLGTGEAFIDTNNPKILGALMLHVEGCAHEDESDASTGGGIE